MRLLLFLRKNLHLDLWGTLAQKLIVLYVGQGRFLRAG